MFSVVNTVGKITDIKRAEKGFQEKKEQVLYNHVIIHRIKSSTNNFLYFCVRSENITDRTRKFAVILYVSFWKVYVSTF